MQTYVSGFSKRPLDTLSHIKSNILAALFCISLITLLDIVYYEFVNESYVFGTSALSKPSYWVTCLIIFVSTFAGRVFFSVFISIIFSLSIFQIMNFEYFGSYILPIHYIQLLPDFLLILSSFVEVIGEMIPVLIFGSVILLLALIVLAPLSRTCAVYPRAGLLILILIGGDFSGNYAFITINKEKLGEPSFKALFPDINQLGIYNAYMSARYLAVGVLPDRLTGKTLDYPSLPAPARIDAPDVNIIVIMNETVRAESMSVLGYELKTTPRLEDLKDLYATSVYSAGTMTRTSFAGFTHRLKYPGIGKQFLSQSNCLFRLAKKNGFDTHFIYSHDRDTADTLLPFMCSKYIDEIRVNTDAPTELQGFDNSLPYHLQNIDLNERNFILIGPTGAHTPYAEKSPDTFKKFEKEYDNAIYYTDHVVADLIEHLRLHSAKPTFVIFTSDHGELLKGEDAKRGHGWFKNEVVRVPFLFLPINDPTPAKTMAEVEKVQSHFDIATLVIELMGYDVSVEDSTDKEIYINGSDLSGLAGQLRLHFIKDQLQSVELINGSGATPIIGEFEFDD